jgi:hypothetical protein
LTGEDKHLPEVSRKKIKTLLFPEVISTKEEIYAVKLGRKEFARGEFEEWISVKKKRPNS